MTYFELVNRLMEIEEDYLPDYEESTMSDDGNALFENLYEDLKFVLDRVNENLVVAE